MKILFISSKPFGLMGTPGTYLLVEAYAQFADICVIANNDFTDHFQIVHKPSNNVKLHEVSFSREDYLNAISKIVTFFNPDIVNVASHREWTKIANHLKDNHPEVNLVFDIKSPLLAPAKSRKAARIREHGQKSIHNVDLVITRSPEDVPTWIPQYAKYVLVYPLGVRLADYSPCNPGEGISGCTRFVYVGAIAPLRQLETMLEYIAALPLDILKACNFDFFGSGPSEKDLVDTIHRLGLENTAGYRGCVDSRALPDLLTNYHAGIAWVPHKLYDASPSLKIVEYTAAGLLPIAMDTTAHRRFADRGFHVSFFSDSPDSFASTIAASWRKGFPVKNRNENLSTIQEYDWLCIAERYILPQFAKLIEPHEVEGRKHLTQPQSNSNAVSAAGFTQQSRNRTCKNLSRLLVISPRSFGLMCTPGTYLLVDSYAKFVDTWVIANKANARHADIVYSPENNDFLYELDFSDRDFLSYLDAIVQQLQPQVVVIGNYIKWDKIVRYLKRNYPSVKCVLDIKTPLIIDGKDNSAYKRIQRRGKKNANLLDLIIAYNLESIKTWIPGWRGGTTIYRLGIKAANFEPVNFHFQRIKCRRFVYIGSIFHLRQLDVLIRYIAALPENLKHELQFDFYGSGPAVEDLQKLVKRLDLENIVIFKGIVASERLSALLSEYDAGLAWVPHEVYEYAPSLKLLEYIAAGIVPLAMDTAGHKRDAEQGFHIEFFSDSAASFGAAVHKAFEIGFPVSQRNENLWSIARHDYDVIAEKEILPALSQLVENSNDTVQTLNHNEKSICQTAAGNERLHKDSKPSSPSSKIYEQVCLWNIPLSQPKPQRLSESKIRIAGILGERLFKSIALESDLLLLTPLAWDSVLSYAKPDFLLMESAWSTAGGHWQLDQGNDRATRHELIEIVKKARELQVPTVFWMTLDSVFHEHFSEFLQHFDYVFCADPREVELLHKDGLSSRTLLPAVQPVLFNPVIEMKGDKAFDAGVLFDGWMDLVQFPEISDTLKKLTASKLSIFQSSQMMFKKHLQGIDSTLLPFVKGSVDALMLPILFKHASMYLSFEKSTATRTEKAWSALETAASRLPIAHLGMIEANDPRFAIVQQFEDESSFCNYVRGHDSFNPAVEQNRHNAWRETFLNHTIAKRLQTICKIIGLEYDWREYPKASLVAGIINAGKIQECIEHYKSQTYPNKELLVIFNGGLEEIEPYRKKYENRDDIRLLSIPLDSTPGTALNFGLHIAKGDYFFYFDNDNAYGPNYVMDTLMCLRAVKADFIGKNAGFLQPEKESDHHARNKYIPKIRFIPTKKLFSNPDNQIISGSLAGRVEILRKHRYPDNLNIVDNALHLQHLKMKCPNSSCLITDQFEVDVNFQHVLSENDIASDSKGSPVKRVLYIGPWKFAPNVGKKNVRIIYPSLFEPLHDCEFHILHGKPELPEYTNELVERYGVVFHRIEGRKLRKWIAKATSLTKDLDIDVLTNVFFGYRYGYVAAKAAQNARRKSVVRFAANEIYVRKCGGAFRGLRGKARYLKEKIMEISAIRMANEVIAMSPWEAKRIENMTSSPDKIKWCMRGIDVKKYAPPHERKYRAARNFLFVGRKRKEKGYRLIETVAGNLALKYPDISFFFAGDFEPGNKENRSYLGYCTHDKLKRLYFELDALILPSESEGFANVIVEAMSMGMPCIISKSFHEKYFRHKEDAMLIDLTARDLERNIINLYTDRDLITKLSINARALAEKEFDSKKWADRYREIIIG